MKQSTKWYLIAGLFIFSALCHIAAAILKVSQ